LIAFNTVVLDVDSTLCGIEGIDWLAARRPETIRAEVANLTRQAMDGEITLESVYGRRLSLVAPTRREIDDLGAEYVRNIATGALDVIFRMQRAGVAVHLISGGLRPAIALVARHAGIPDENVHAVEVRFDAEGSYSSFDSSSPLIRHLGKKDLLAELNPKRRSLMVGDGITDAEARPVVDAFAAFTGFANRQPVIEQGDFVFSTFEEILAQVVK